MVSLRSTVLLTFFFSCAHVASSVGTSATLASSLRLNVNPIRRVVTMMQHMQKKVEQEGKKEQELFDAFMCYCKNGVGSLEKSIEDAGAKIDQLTSGIEETSSALKQLKADTIKAKADRKE